MRNRLAILIFLGLGFGFLLIGGILATFGSSAASASAARAERLQSTAAGALEGQAVGSEVLVEGRISSRNQPRFHSFVAYIREEFRGTDENERDADNQPKENWVEDQHITPPLLLELSDGAVQIANSDYTFDSAPARWQESSTLTWNGFKNEGTKRYYGFEANNPALAIGTVVDTNEGHAVQAEFIYGGNRAAYIASQRSSATALRWIGIGFAVAGAVLAAVGMWMFFKPKPVVENHAGMTDEEFFGEDFDEDEADEDASSETRGIASLP